MTAPALNPKVKVGDRIVALEFGGHGICGAYHNKPGTVTDVRRPSLLAVKFDEIPAGLESGSCTNVTSWRLAEPEPYVPAVGHRVRVVLEGEVKYVRDSDDDPASNYFTLSGSGITDVTYSGAELVSVERLPEPEPEVPGWWPPQSGDVVAVADRRAADPISVYRNEKSCVTIPLGIRWSDDELRKEGTLTLLVRDGKPYGGAQ